MTEWLRLALAIVVAIAGIGMHLGLANTTSRAPTNVTDHNNADTNATVTDDAAIPGGRARGSASNGEGDDVASSWGDQVDGLLRFRGNLTHTYYGSGPLPDEPQVSWRFPERPMCITERLPSQEVDDEGVPVVAERQWCGTGWTGQPIVWQRPDGITEVIIGGFDGLVYFLNGDSGEPTREPFRTNFQIKGTGALDPDGYPLYYTGSRDGRFRVLALDREPVEELWSMGPHPQRVWNDDWDGSPAILDDVLYVGGEDSWFRAIRLHRDYDDAGNVVVNPETLIELPGFNDELFAAVGDRNVSIENSVAIDVARDRLAFANSGGRLLVLELSALAQGRQEVVLDLWLGDDIDASIVIGDAGELYVAIELQRFLPRAREVGQLVRIDVDRPDDPIVWSVDIPPNQPDDDGGSWATPALYDGMLYIATHPGELLVVDTDNGTVVFRDALDWHSWSSPVVVVADDRAQLLVATCMDPHLRAYDLSRPETPVEQWRLPLPGCIESTPAVWRGRIWVGSRDGFFYAIR